MREKRLSGSEHGISKRLKAAGAGRRLPLLRFYATILLRFSNRHAI
jgi:hypothetical protein